MNRLITRILDVLLCRCPKCHKRMSVLRDMNGTDFGYGLYYCPECDNMMEE